MAARSETPFDIEKYLITLEGDRKYMPVKHRLMLMRTEHPTASLETALIDFTDGYVLFRCSILCDNEAQATGHGYCLSSDHRAIEKAEVAAVGRALAFLGYGTAYAELDELSEQVRPLLVSASTTAEGNRVAETLRKGQQRAEPSESRESSRDRSQAQSGTQRSNSAQRAAQQPSEASTEDAANSGQITAIKRLAEKRGWELPVLLEYVSKKLGRKVSSVQMLSSDEAGTIIAALQSER